MIGFNSEKDFEKALITVLESKGWQAKINFQKVLKYPTEEDLINNWAAILFQNNNTKDRLNGCPLVKEEMQQILEQVTTLRTPLALNGFINGKSIAIKRKNEADKAHYGKEVSLKIYDRMEVAGGNSVYQIAEQPVFSRKSKVLQDRRGDLMLLINGMPLFHIELKKSGIPVSEACHQIEKYAHEQIFTGLFSLIQIFVAMTPEETVYFANPGPDGKFNRDFYFHWEDFNNDIVNDWKDVATQLLSIPMAHQLIGFYTVADSSDGILKVMRSYQYYAANKISDRVTKNDWTKGNQLGGYIWHTTGSGKTMTSFKSAQLIANSKRADKVVFLMDRVELGTQSLKEYRAFADDERDVQETEDTIMLIEKLKSDKTSDTLIVSSIQKMSNIRGDAEGKMRARDLEKIKNKRIVFIIDECHRSTFGEMLSNIKHTFPHALFFGFTGTPVFEENEKKFSTTTDIFGNELHRYSLADGIRDKNVLGFDPSMVKVYKDKELRQQVAMGNAKTDKEHLEEDLKNPTKSRVYYKYMDSTFPMAGYMGDNGRWVKGIEDFIPLSQYENDDYQQAVVNDISDNWVTMSRSSKFHAIFATSSIPEAIRYYRKFKETAPQLHVTCLFDPTIDNEGGRQSLAKEDGLQEILEDYNDLYGMNFDIGGYGKFRKDVSSRLAHKAPYERIKPEEQLNLLIVVNQMLTGFDSKWVNTLYLDKVMEYQNLIQAFSRTNRLFNINEKPFGSIRYYRMPHTMKRNIEEAVKLYSGDRPRGLFADHLPDNLRHMNETWKSMIHVFKDAGIPDLEKLPEDKASRAEFAKLFREFSTFLQAAEIQGFVWSKKVYQFIDGEDDIDENGGTEKNVIIEVLATKEKYEILHQRYRELRTNNPGPGPEDVPFDIDPYLTDESTGVIDYAYMNSRFEKYRKQLNQPGVTKEELTKTMDSLHRSFAFLSQENQRYANLFLHDVQTGDIQLKENYSFQDYIFLYANREENNQIHLIGKYLGIDEDQLRAMLNINVTRENINEYGRFDKLKATIDKKKAKKYLEAIEGKRIPLFRVNQKAEKLLMDFILAGGMDIPESEEGDSESACGETK